jgi:putative ABC transport system permease protein
MSRLLSDLRIVIRSLRRSRNRTLVAVLTVAGGIIGFLLAGGFIEWIFEGMRESTIHSQLGHVQIVRPGYLEKGIADPYQFLLPERAKEFAELSKLSGAVSVTERLAFSGLASFKEQTVSFIGEGIDPKRETVISDHVVIDEGRQLTGPADKAALLGEGLAKNLGVKVGDSIVLLATAANGAPNAVEVTVAGIFHTPSKEFDDFALRMPIDIVRRLMRVQGATSWVILLDRTERTTQTVDGLRKSLAVAEYQVIPWIDLADFYNKTVVLFSKQISMMKAVIGLIIILTILNSQTMSVLERTTEIGTIMAVGLRRSAVLRIFIIEGALLGAIGGVLGVTVGYGLSLVISEIGIPMPPPPGMARGFTGEIRVTLQLVLDGLSLALLTTLVASILPAVKASRMNIVDALRCNQ